ncbi:MAG: hypothetical protein QXH20_06360 [Candidatus Bathyarchaeia archaeon]
MSEEVIYSVVLGKNRKLHVTNKRVILAPEINPKYQHLVGLVTVIYFTLILRLGLSLFLALLPAYFYFVFFLALRNFKEQKQLKVKGKSFSPSNSKITVVRSSYSRIEPVKFSIEDDAKKVKFELPPKEGEELVKVFKNIGSFILEELYK